MLAFVALVAFLCGAELGWGLDRRPTDLPACGSLWVLAGLCSIRALSRWW